VRILLIGGGKVGSYLAREFVTDGHVVSVIEESVERARTVIEESGALVFEGDGTDVELLRSADVDRTDWVLAVTGRDEDNLVACELAATLGAKHVLARLNNPRNRPTFDALKIPVIGVTDLMAGVISHEVEVSDLSRVALMGGGKISLVERSIPEGFPETPL
jgi:trk system potassium uptake protein TrkA